LVPPIIPNQPRLDAPETLHHLIGRGMERRSRFRDDGDRADFVARQMFRAAAQWLRVLPKQCWECPDATSPITGAGGTAAGVRASLTSQVEVTRYPLWGIALRMDRGYSGRTNCRRLL
jgi:hypothetical protein